MYTTLNDAITMARQRAIALHKTMFVICAPGGRWDITSTPCEDGFAVYPFA